VTDSARSRTGCFQVLYVFLAKMLLFIFSADTVFPLSLFEFGSGGFLVVIHSISNALHRRQKSTKIRT